MKPGIASRILLPLLPLIFATANAQVDDEERGAALYDEHCARCHDVPDTRAPPKSTLEQMAVSRIVRTMDFGVMMSVTYMLDREDRAAVAAYLGVPGEDRSPPASAMCSDRSVRLGPELATDWNGWSPADDNARFQSNAGFASNELDRLELAWAFGFGGDVNAFAPPAILGQELFVGSAGGSIYALDAATGCIKWHFQADGPVRTAMLVAPLVATLVAPFDGGDTDPDADANASHAVMFGDQSGGFYALSAASGALLWRARPEPHESTKLTGTPVATNGIVYVPVASWEESRPLNAAYECCTFRGSVVAYRIADGAEIWKSWLVTEEPERIGATETGVAMFGPSGVGTWSAPTIDRRRGLLYVTTGNNYTGQTAHSDAVVALDMTSGDIVWSEQLTPGDEFNLYCSRREEGCPGGDTDIGASSILVELDDGRERLLVGQKSGIVFGLDPASEGEILWQARVGQGGINGGVQWGMASDGVNVYASVSDLARRQQDDRDAVDPRPNGVDPASGGGLTALDVETGERVWFAAPPPCSPAQTVCSPAQPAALTAMPGAVFSGSVDGHLRAFSADDGSILWDFDTAREYEAVNGVAARGGSLDGDGAVIANGRLYVTSGYGRNGGMPGNVLLAFEIASAP